MQFDRALNCNPGNKNISQYLNLLLIVIILSSLIAAYLVGINRSNIDIVQLLPELIDGIDGFNKQEKGVYSAFINEPDKRKIVYITVGEANGYGGPMKVMVLVLTQK